MSATPEGAGRERRTAPVRAHVRDDGALVVNARLVIPADEVALRVTTSGGPGGQHANRSLTRVVASFDVKSSAVLSAHQRDVLAEQFGAVVRSSASRFRSQGANREAALDQLARRLGEALAPRAPRRATRPTRASRVRRLDDKRARSRVKEQRRRREDD